MALKKKKTPWGRLILSVDTAAHKVFCTWMRLWNSKNRTGQKVSVWKTYFHESYIYKQTGDLMLKIIFLLAGMSAAYLRFTWLGCTHRIIILVCWHCWKLCRPVSSLRSVCSKKEVIGEGELCLQNCDSCFSSRRSSINGSKGCWIFSVLSWCVFFLSFGAKKRTDRSAWPPSPQNSWTWQVWFHKALLLCGSSGV